MPGDIRLTHNIRITTFVLGIVLAAGGLFLSAETAYSQVRITEVLADPVGANTGLQKVEITNVGIAVQDISRWRICVPFVYRTFPDSLDLDPGETYIIHIRLDGVNDDNNFYTDAFFPELSTTSKSFILYGPLGSFGDPTALVDYVGWGFSPQPREITGVTAGAWQTGNFVPVVSEGRSFQLCDTLLHSANSWVELAPTIGAVNAACPVIKPNIVINEVLFDPIGANSGSQIIEIRNLEGVSVDIANWNLCYSLTYWAFPEPCVIPPGQRIAVHINAVGVDDAKNKYTGNINPLSAANTDVGLYLPIVTEDDFADSSFMVDFVQYGAGGQNREGVAVGAGLWSAGDFVPLPFYEGLSIQLCVPADTSTSWNAQEPTIREPNNCTLFKPAVVLNEVLLDPVGPTAPGLQKIEIRNADTRDVDLENFQICFQLMYWPLPTNSVLSPGELLVIHLNATGVDTKSDKYTGAFFDLSPSKGALGLYSPINTEDDFADPAFILDFVQWGATGLDREDVADAAGIWVAGDSLVTPAEGRSLERCADPSGVGSWSETPDITIGSPNTCSTVSVADGRSRVLRFGRPTPNPMQGGTSIQFELSRSAHIEAKIFDLRGREVATLADQIFGAGVNRLEWNGRGGNGARLGPGVYFIRVSSPDALGPGGEPWRATTRVVLLGR